MTGRELQEKLYYHEMERGIRRLAVKDKLAKTEEVAVMATKEVCDLVAQEYVILSSESEELILVKNENIEKVEELIERIQR